MKKGIHPDYHEIKVVMTDGTEYLTRSTYGEPGAVLHLDIDSEDPPGLDRRRPAPARPRRPRVALQQPLQGPHGHVVRRRLAQTSTKARVARAFFVAGRFVTSRSAGSRGEGRGDPADLVAHGIADHRAGRRRPKAPSSRGRAPGGGASGR